MIKKNVVQNTIHQKSVDCCTPPITPNTDLSNLLKYLFDRLKIAQNNLHVCQDLLEGQKPSNPEVVGTDMQGLFALVYVCNNIADSIVYLSEDVKTKIG